MKPYILVTNDDGIHAPGLKALWGALSQVADTVVVAPADEQSATGLSITWRNPIWLEEEQGWPGASAWAVRGTPADTVKMALSVILKRKPDLIVSGINKGSNAGRNILYSGTVSAVIEGSMQNVPGVAFSCYDYNDPDYQLAATHVPSIVRYALEHPLPEGTILNVNFPEKRHAPYKGIKFSRQGKGYWRENPSLRTHPSEGHSYWWLGLQHAEYDEHEESDIAQLHQGYISSVPISIADLTHERVFEERKKGFEDYFSTKKFIEENK